MRDFRKHTAWYLTGYPVGPRGPPPVRAGVDADASSTNCSAASTGRPSWSRAASASSAATPTARSRSPCPTASSTTSTISTSRPRRRRRDGALRRLTDARLRARVGGSPRRRELLALLGLPFEVVPADIDESVASGEKPVDVRPPAGARQGATAIAVSTTGDVVVLAADTTVDVDGEILGKPADADDARRMLRSLSAPHPPGPHGRRRAPRRRLRPSQVVTTSVTMAAMSDADDRVVPGDGRTDRQGRRLRHAGRRRCVRRRRSRAARAT